MSPLTEIRPMTEEEIENAGWRKPITPDQLRSNTRKGIIDQKDFLEASKVFESITETGGALLTFEGKGSYYESISKAKKLNNLIKKVFGIRLQIQISHEISEAGIRIDQIQKSTVKIKKNPNF